MQLHGPVMKSIFCVLKYCTEVLKYRYFVICLSECVYELQRVHVIVFVHSLHIFFLGEGIVRF